MDPIPEETLVKVTGQRLVTAKQPDVIGKLYLTPLHPHLPATPGRVRMLTAGDRQKDRPMQTLCEEAESGRSREGRLQQGQ